ncbi:MAG TPA: glycosyltransferase family 39 protein [Burkholderiales bacterium]|nr:glycosyltransferase family 39 protein [Burkholderiales bacterium]
MSPRIELPLGPKLLALLLLAYLLPGLVAHDLWKTEDAIGIGIVHQMLEHGRWLVPHLAGEPYWEDGPFHYWIAALTAKLFGLVLATHDGARLASGLVMAAVIALVHLAGRELYGRLEATGALLALLGSLGLLIHAHETLGEISMLAGQALAWYGIALAQRKPHHGGWLLGLGLAVAALSKGVPAVIAPLAVALVAPAVSSAWRRREYFPALTQALLLFALIFGGWLALADHAFPGFVPAWRDASVAQFVVPPAAALGLWGPILAWATWPAWPLAVWTLWEARRRSYSSGTRILITAVIASFAVLVFLVDPREVYALPLLLPLSLLAGAGVPSLRRGAANGLTWFGVMCAGFFGVLMWLGWFAMTTGFPAAIARNFTRLEPGHVQHFSWVAFIVALACSLGWLWLIIRSERSAPFRSVTFWAAGITLLWALGMTLILSWIDYGKSYRTVAEALRKNIPERARCVESRGLGEAQRAILDYRVEIVTRRIESGGDTGCPFLLVQARLGDSDNLGPGWKFMWEGRRPRDRERYRLYQSIGKSQTREQP